MLAITLDQAKNIALVVAVIFVLAAGLAAWVMKTIAQKVAIALVLVVIAGLIFLARTDLQNCANDVIDSADRRGVDLAIADTSCTFFGFDVTISDPRDNGDG